MDCVVTKDLSLGYGESNIIEKMSMSIPKGKVTVIIGANGCGKSTLLKSIARIIKPTNGKIFIDGMDVSTTPSKEIAKKMAILPQNPKAPAGLKVDELVSYGRFPHKSGLGSLNKQDYEIIDESLKLAGVYDFKDKGVDELSGGQRQRVWIAMALCQRTEMLVLDEPTTYLDLTHQLDILSLLSKLNKSRGTTIIMVLHELNTASRFADYMVGMKSGKVVASGSPIEVVTKENLRTIYNIEADIVFDEKTSSPMYLSYENIVNNT